MVYHPPKTGVDYSHNMEGPEFIYSPSENEAQREYDLQQKYMENKKGENPLSNDYHRLGKDEMPKDSIEKNIEQEEKIKKYESKDNRDNVKEIAKKQAELEINQEINKAGFKDSKKERTIEEAIKSAIEKEQRLLVAKQ